MAVVRGDEGADGTEDEGQVLPAGAGALRLLDGLREQLARRARAGAPCTALTMTSLRRVLAERAGQPDEGDEALHEDEGDGEGQRAGVAEAVGHPQPLEGVGQEPAAAGVEQRLAGVVAGELPRLGHEGGGAHGSPGPARRRGWRPARRGSSGAWSWAGRRRRARRRSSCRTGRRWRCPTWSARAATGGPCRSPCGRGRGPTATRPEAVTTPTSRRPSSGSAVGKAVMPPADGADVGDQHAASSRP